MIIARLYWDNDHASPWVSLPNRTEYNNWARDVRRARPGTRTEYAFCDASWTADTLLVRAGESEPPPEHIKRENKKKENAMNKLDRIEAQIEALNAEKLRLSLLPVEPDTDHTEGTVLWFIKTFGGFQEYTYAAVKAGDGLWYTTGPRSPKGYTWDDLIEWIGPDVEVWVASEWSLL